LPWRRISGIRSTIALSSFALLAVFEPNGAKDPRLFL
jgi:hypothetical protein